MSIDEPLEQKAGPKWPSQKQQKQTNYDPKQGRGYTKPLFNKAYRLRRNRKNKLAKIQRRQQRRRMK